MAIGRTAGVRVLESFQEQGDRARMALLIFTETQ